MIAAWRREQNTPPAEETELDAVLAGLAENFGGPLVQIPLGLLDAAVEFHDTAEAEGYNVPLGVGAALGRLRVCHGPVKDPRERECRGR
jgi:hypothetical protein